MTFNADEKIHIVLELTMIIIPINHALFCHDAFQFLMVLYNVDVLWLVDICSSASSASRTASAVMVQRGTRGVGTAYSGHSGHSTQHTAQSGHCMRIAIEHSFILRNHDSHFLLSSLWHHDIRQACPSHHQIDIFGFASDIFDKLNRSSNSETVMLSTQLWQK